MEFDLFWLTAEELLNIKAKHHGPLDSSKETNTEINFLQQLVSIRVLAGSIDKPWAQNLLRNMHSEGRSSFTLSEEFLALFKAENSDSTIDFESIAAQEPREGCILRIIEQKSKIESENQGGNPERE